jgi:hypothetical protein
MSERGGISVRKGRVYARIRFGKNERFEERLPWATPDDEGASRERSRLIAELVDRLVSAGRRDLVRRTAREAAQAMSPRVLDTIRKTIDVVIKTPAPRQDLTTFKDVADAWVSGELRKLHPDHVRSKADFRLEVGRLKRYIYPHVKDVPVVAFEKAHADLVMSKLPASRVKTPAARRHIAQIMSRVMNMCVHPLGLIKSSPLGKGFLPIVTRSKHYTCLFPKEEAKLLGCEEVDEAFRLFMGILDREGMRISELADSEWWQWNLEVGTFTATKTKGGDPRMWALRPDVVRAMRIWAERFSKKKARPFIDVTPTLEAKKKLAKRLREALALAGVQRQELFRSTQHTGMLRAHDLRATFVTVSLAEGRPEAWIRDRTAHKSTMMIDRYRRTARQFEELNLGSLVDLVEGLGWAISWVIRSAVGGAETSDRAVVTSSSGAGIRTPIGGSKIRSGHDHEPRQAQNDVVFDAGDDPQEQGSPTRHPGVRRLPADVQEYVAGQLAEAYREAIRGEQVATLRPLARAATAIEQGRTPRRRRGAR